MQEPLIPTPVSDPQLHHDPTNEKKKEKKKKRKKERKKEKEKKY